MSQVDLFEGQYELFKFLFVDAFVCSFKFGFILFFRLSLFVAFALNFLGTIGDGLLVVSHGLLKAVHLTGNLSLFKDLQSLFDLLDHVLLLALSFFLWFSLIAWIRMLPLKVATILDMTHHVSVGLAPQSPTPWHAKATLIDPGKQVKSGILKDRE